MQIVLANKEDSSEILDLQKLAYKQEAEIYNDYTIPPLTQTIEGIRQDFNDNKILKYVDNKKIIGSIRVFIKNDTCYIGRVIVHPEHQNKGIGTKLMLKTEEIINYVKRYELFTGEKSDKNIYFYQKLGYKIFKKEKLNENVNIIYLEKKNKNY